MRRSVLALAGVLWGAGAQAAEPVLLDVAQDPSAELAVHLSDLLVSAVPLEVCLVGEEHHARHLESRRQAQLHPEHQDLKVSWLSIFVLVLMVFFVCSLNHSNSIVFLLFYFILVVIILHLYYWLYSSDDDMEASLNSNDLKVLHAETIYPKCHFKKIYTINNFLSGGRKAGIKIKVYQCMGLRAIF